MKEGVAEWQKLTNCWKAQNLDLTKEIQIVLGLRQDEWKKVSQEWPKSEK